MGSAWFLYEALALLRSAGCYGQLLTRAASDSQRVGARDICLRVLSDGFMHTQREVPPPYAKQGCCIGRDDVWDSR